MLKLVALDLDHTLLNDESQLPRENIEAVAKVREQGVQVMITTGRMYYTARLFAQELGLTGSIICYNGALVKDLDTDEELVHHPLDLKLAKEILSYAQREGIHANLYYQDRVYYERYTKEAEYYENQVKLTGKNVGDLVEFLPGPPTKLLYIMEPEKVQHLWQVLGEKYEGKLDLTVSESRYLEFLAPGVNKGRALAEFMAQRGLKKEEVMAVGDSFNDLELLKTAGLSVAMGNAPDEVKAVADHVTGTNEDAGVAQALERFVLKT